MPHRERLWRRFVEEIVLERDDPRAASMRKGKLASRAPLPPPPALARDARRERASRADDGVDKAYQREYLEVDRKRMRHV